MKVRSSSVVFGFKSVLNTTSNTTSNTHNRCWTKQMTRKFETNFRLAVCFLMRIAVVLNTFRIGRKFLAEH
jgi:hypothetical protein